MRSVADHSKAYFGSLFATREDCLKIDPAYEWEGGLWDFGPALAALVLTWIVMDAPLGERSALMSQHGLSAAVEGLLRSSWAPTQIQRTRLVAAVVPHFGAWLQALACKALGLKLLSVELPQMLCSASAATSLRQTVGAPVVTKSFIALGLLFVLCRRR